MRKTAIILLSVFLVLAWGCGKPGDSGPERKGGSDQARSKGAPDTRPSSNPGQKPGSKMDLDNIDIDRLNIPPQLKEAIKSGRIPREQIPEILARMRGEGQGEATPVNLAKVQRKSLKSYLVLSGFVEPERKVEVFSRLSAYVKQILKEEGAYVREGEVLALLDDKEIRISYEQARIQLEQAQLSLDEAEQNYNRNQELIKKDLISEQEFQAQEGQYKQRQLDYKDRLESFKNLELQLNWTRIRALSEGFITERLIEVGDRVNSNEQVYTIEDFKPLLIRVFVPTSDAIRLNTDMLAEVTTEVLQGALFNGNVKLINPRIDTQTGTVKVTVEIYDDTARLKPGMFVSVRIAIGEKESVLAIPRKAILYKQNKTFVFVFNQGMVTQREVTLGLTEEDDVEVVEGLSEGEFYVTVGVEGLKDGQRVEVLR